MNKKCLVFFSGGKDSFITACLQVEKGYDVTLIYFNNGSSSNAKNVRLMAERIQKRYSADRVHYAGVCPTAGAFSLLRNNLYTMRMCNIAEKYPHMTLSQGNCLCCQSSMWICGIAYCLAKDINVISTGYICTDEFCTGSRLWHKQLKLIADQFNIEIEYPVMNRQDWKDNQFSRDLEMLLRGFSNAVLEPKCMIGAEPGIAISDAESSLLKFYEDNILQHTRKLIDEHVTIYKNIILGDEAYI